MRILFLSTWLPYPTTNGSKLRVYGLLRGLAQEHEISLLCFTDQESQHQPAPELKELCREVKMIPARAFGSTRNRRLSEWLDPTPQLIQQTYSPEMERSIQAALASGHYDLVIASQLGAAVYSSSFEKTPAIFEEVELGVLYEKYARASSSKAKLRNGLTWIKHRRYVARLLPTYQACTVVSEQERQLLSREIPAYRAVETVPNFIDLSSYQGSSVSVRPNSLIFTGPFRYFANHEAMVWFLEQVYPLIQAEIPDVNLTITGDHADLPLPSSRNVTLTGFVDDIRPLLASTTVSIVPLLSGGGTRLKILEAMALGVPVVSTSKGVEGLDVIAGKHFLVADTAQGFAEQIVRLFKQPALRAEIGSSARQLVGDHYDYSVIMPRFLKLVERLGSQSWTN